MFEFDCIHMAPYIFNCFLYLVILHILSNFLGDRASPFMTTKPSIKLTIRIPNRYCKKHIMVYTAINIIVEKFRKIKMFKPSF